MADDSKSYRKRKLINKPFGRLKPRQRAVYILHIAGYTYKDIYRLGIASPRTITIAIRKGYEEYKI